MTSHRPSTLHVYTGEPVDRRARARQLGQHALAAAAARRYADDRATLAHVEAVAGRTSSYVRALLDLTSTPIRANTGSPPRRRPIRHSRMRIGYLPPLHRSVIEADLGRTALLAALHGAGHQVTTLRHDRAPALARQPNPAYAPHDVVVVELTRPPGGPRTATTQTAGTAGLDDLTRLVRYYARRGTATVIWDLDDAVDQLAPTILDLPRLHVATSATRPGRTQLRYPISDQSLDHCSPRQLARLQRDDVLLRVEPGPGPHGAVIGHLTITDIRAGSLAPAESYPIINPRDMTDALHTSLATLIEPAPGHTVLGHHLAHLARAVTAGCLPLVRAAFTDAAEFVPRQLVIRDDRDLATTLDLLTAIQGSEAHHDLIAACLLYLQRYRVSHQAPTLLTLLHTLARHPPPPEQNTATRPASTTAAPPA